MFFAFCTARDKIHVSKDEDLEAEREKRHQRAAMLREVADELVATTSAHPTAFAAHQAALADKAALYRVAAWQEKQLTFLRTPDDLLTITNDRGDPHARGAGIMIATFLEERFGKPLYGTAATLTAVALGISQDGTGIPTIERAIRSAFSAQKRG